MCDGVVVSAIITTYNRKKEILECAINSIIDQTYRKIEIILVDDNGVGTELQKENEQQFSAMQSVKYIANKRNSGAQFSRNQGILHSSGEFIAFLDDDDYWAPQKIDRQLKELEDESIGLVFCDGYIIEDNSYNNNKLYQSRDVFEKSITYEDMLFRDYVGSTSQVLIRKKCFAMAGLFDINLLARQDYEMWIRLSRYTKFKGIDEPLFYHRLHSGKQISKDDRKCYEGYKYIENKYHKDYMKNNKANARINMKKMKHAWGIKRFTESIRCLVIAVINDPFFVVTTILKKIHISRLSKSGLKQ